MIKQQRVTFVAIVDNTGENTMVGTKGANYSLTKERNMYVILDPAPADGIFDGAFKYADLVNPNKQETKRITGIDVTDETSALEAAKKLNELGISDVIVKWVKTEAWFTRIEKQK